MTNYLNVKNGIEILHSNSLTQILAGGVDPSIEGVVANLGSIYLHSNGAGLYIKVTEDNTGWVLSNQSDNINIDQHIALHNPNIYTEYSYIQGKVYQETEWLDDNKDHLISVTTINKDGNIIIGTTKDIYDYLTGTTVIATVTTIINRQGNDIQSITSTRDNTIGGL